MTADPTAPLSPAAPGAGLPRPSPRATVVAVVVIVLAVGVALGARWWTHPTVFQDAGYGFVAAPRQVATATLHVAITEPSAEDGPLTIRGAEARVASDTAASATTVVKCRFKGSATLGAATGSLDRFCSDVVAIGGDEDIALDPATEVLVLSLSPTRRGKTQVTGVTLDYATGRPHLWQRGEQTVGLDITVRAR